MADGGGLENRYGAEASSWVRIPRPPLTCGFVFLRCWAVPVKGLARSHCGHMLAGPLSRVRHDVRDT